MRPNGRADDELRLVRITKDFITTAEGSVLIEMGSTRIICTATIEDKVPQFLKDKGRGWVTAEYSLLPRSTPVRVVRESQRGKIGGRTHEIQRLIGRSIRSVVDMDLLGERTVLLDCDVIQADGGTRTAAITGAFVCLAYATKYALELGMITESPLKDYVAAVSVGVVEGRTLLDLCYEEDFNAEVDMNVVMTGSGRFVEVQGTAEAAAFERRRLDEMLDLASGGIGKLIEMQRAEIPEGMLKLR
jgi:ribonuclease PH